MKMKFPFFSKKPSKSIGLDIGSSQLKLIELDATKNSAQVTSMAMQDIRQSKNISDEIKKIFNDNKISSSKVNVAVSGDGVIARYLSMPKMSYDELKKAISYELEEHIPFKPEEVYTDFFITGEDTTAKNKMHVFLVATKKELLDKYISMLEKAELTPKIITMDALCLMNIFCFNYPDKIKSNVTVLNIGERTTNLIITRDKTPYFVRDTRFGGETVTSIIQNKLNIAKDAAEEIKLKLSSQDIELAKTIKTTLATLLNEIFVSIDFYENLTEKKIDEIYLSGGSCLLYGLKEFLSGYLGIQINPLDPFKNITFAPSIAKEKIAEQAPFMAVAAGLALEEA
ncbi:MAG: pilus assembly protein PilM [Candidatus Omnitrophica bacterium]|jgi:type IV pilus assembly protein PilM|nr:pilus assembly protein PilM [Candidatus Omnitrophota bacterium]